MPQTETPPLAALLEQSRESVMLFRPDGSLLWMNARAYDALLCPRDNRSTPNASGFAPDFGDLPLSVRLRQCDSIQSQTLEGSFLRVDGTRWNVTLRAQRLSGSMDAPILAFLTEKADLEDGKFLVHQRVAIETALAAISGRLMHAANEDIDTAIRESLADLCAALNTECGSVIQRRDDNAGWAASHVWFSAGQSGSGASGSFVSHDQLEAIWRQLRDGATVAMEFWEDGARNEFVQASAFAAVAFAPLAHGGETMGCVALGRVHAQAPWRDEETRALCRVADLFATALERRRMLLEMSRRLQFESLVGEVASSLLRTPANLLDAGIEESLTRLAAYLRADRAAVLLLSGDRLRFGVSHEFCAPSLVPMRETLQDLPVVGLIEPWTRGRSADPSIVAHRDELPASADQVRGALEAFGIESVLGVPLVLGSEVVGGIVFGRASSERTWGDEEVSLLRACADIIITTIQRLRIEQALRESDEKFSRTFIAMPDSVTISEIESGTIVEANPAFESTSGFALSDVLGNSTLEMDFWNDPSDRERLVKDVLRVGVVRNRELIMKHACGRQIDVLVSAVKIELRGRPYLCTVMRDISEAKAANQALRLAEAALRELNLDLEARVKSRTAELETSLRELESFSYSVSHDLRSPLRGINGFASLLSEDYADRLDDNGRDYLKRIALATERMGNLIDELLDLARISRVPMRKSSIDLAAIGRAVVAELHDAEPGRKVEIAIADSLPASADHGLIQVALSNLLGNAWKFTGAARNPRIELGLRVTDAERQFYVRDNGAGFDMDNSQLLFRPFSRLHRPTEFPGSGIGLATVARIIQRHGGRIWAEGEVGRGATFYFTLG